MVYLSLVSPANGGFGDYQLGESQEFENFDTVAELVNHIINENSSIREIVEDDEEYEQVLNADEKIYNQGNGEVVGFVNPNDNWSVELYLITVAESEN